MKLFSLFLSHKLCTLLHPTNDSNVLTRNSHFQISSDSAYKVRRRTLSRSTRSSFMSVNVQKQHFIQHDLAEFWRKLCHKLQASSKKLFCMDKILQWEGYALMIPNGFTKEKTKSECTVQLSIFESYSLAIKLNSSRFFKENKKQTYQK